MRIAIYARRSTDEHQAASLGVQIEEATRFCAAGHVPSILSLAHLTDADAGRLLRGDDVAVPDVDTLAQILGVEPKDIIVAGGTTRAATSNDDGAPPLDDGEPVMAPARQEPARRAEDIVDEGSSVSPMEAALRAAVASSEGALRDEDMELVGTVLALGEAPSGVSRRELSAIGARWLHLAASVRGRDDAAALLLDLAAGEGGRVGQMAAKILARLEAQQRAARAAKPAREPKPAKGSKSTRGGEGA